ncbi:helix-turn-helix transcriptional regulator [Paraburkholderia aspalathi]|jgi:transcriptional regulator with XRE-family HTH domain|uniref:helix-turn-helix domain-containing protein n=1 Tax=Paraburkholderia aspalathi TaxID=1324617 RepID=UPI0038B72860
MNKPTPKKSTAAAAPAQKKAALPEVERPKKTSVSPAIRKHVAANLKRWMASDPNLDTQVKVATASKVAQTTVSRILKGETPATADILDAIAKAFRRDPGDLLTNNADMKVQYDVAKFARLPDYERVRIEAYIKHVLAEHELPSTDEPKKKTSR